MKQTIFFWILSLNKDLIEEFEFKSRHEQTLQTESYKYSPVYIQPTSTIQKYKHVTILHRYDIDHSNKHSS